MRRFLLATAIASPLFLSAPSSRAQMPVIDFAALGQWFQQIQYALQTVQQLQQQVQQAINTVRALTNIPANLAGQVVGLLQSTIQNPLQGINLNLQSLMMGSGSGVCPGAGGMLSATQGWTATGGDFLGSMMNGGATQLAGLLACTQQMMQAAQQRLSADAAAAQRAAGLRRRVLHDGGVRTHPVGDCDDQHTAAAGSADGPGATTAAVDGGRSGVAEAAGRPGGDVERAASRHDRRWLRSWHRHGRGGGVVAAAPVFNASSVCIPWHAGCP